MNEYRVNDVDLSEFLHSFTDGDGKLPSDFEQLKTEGHYLIHGDEKRRFCLKERQVYLKDTMENLLAKSICFFSDMPISYAVHVRASGRADIAVLNNRKLSMEIKEKQVRGKSITVKYWDGTVDRGPLKTEKYIKGSFGEKVNTIYYPSVADSLLRLSRKVYSLSYEAENERSLSAAVREIHKKREDTLAVKPPDFLRAWMEDIKLLSAIRQTGYLQGVSDESRISQLKELMGKEGYMRITPELAAQAKKFNLPCFTLQKDGNIGYVHDMQPMEKGSLLLMKEDWLKMLDILMNERSVCCSRKMLTGLRETARESAAKARKEENKVTFASTAIKLDYFLEAIDRNDLSHILKEHPSELSLPEFISEQERKKLQISYQLPEQTKQTVADRNPRYFEEKSR